MGVGIDSGESTGNRPPTGVAARRKSRLVIDDGRQPVPAECDADAFLTELYGRYWTPLIGYVSRATRNVHEAEEIVQETMLRAWHHAGRLDPEQGSVWGWLRQVAHNITVDRVRHRRARPAEVEATAAKPNAEVAADHADDVVNSVYVRDAITRLQPAHRAVLYYVYFQQRTCAEAAAILGLPVGTVKSRLHYALRHIRIVLGQDQATSA